MNFGTRLKARNAIVEHNSNDLDTVGIVMSQTYRWVVDCPGQSALLQCPSCLRHECRLDDDVV
jgi:hypothetical protein